LHLAGSQHLRGMPRHCIVMQTGKSRPLWAACWGDGTTCFHAGAKKWTWCEHCGKGDRYVSKSKRWCYECFEQQVSPSQLCDCHRVARLASRSDGFEGPPRPPSTPAPRIEVRPPPPPAPSMPGQSSTDMWEEMPPLLALMPPHPGSTTLAASTTPTPGASASSVRWVQIPVDVRRASAMHPPTMATPGGVAPVPAASIVPPTWPPAAARPPTLWAPAAARPATVSWHSAPAHATPAESSAPASATPAWSPGVGGVVPGSHMRQVAWLQSRVAELEKALGASRPNGEEAWPPPGNSTAAPTGKPEAVGPLASSTTLCQGIARCASVGGVVPVPSDLPPLARLETRVAELEKALERVLRPN